MMDKLTFVVFCCPDGATNGAVIDFLSVGQFFLEYRYQQCSQIPIPETVTMNCADICSIQ